MFDDLTYNDYILYEMEHLNGVLTESHFKGINDLTLINKYIDWVYKVQPKQDQGDVKYIGFRITQKRAYTHIVEIEGKQQSLSSVKLPKIITSKEVLSQIKSIREAIIKELKGIIFLANSDSLPSYILDNYKDLKEVIQTLKSRHNVRQLFKGSLDIFVEFYNAKIGVPFTLVKLYNYIYKEYYIKELQFNSILAKLSEPNRKLIENCKNNSIIQTYALDLNFMLILLDADNRNDETLLTNIINDYKAVKELCVYIVDELKLDLKLLQKSREFDSLNRLLFNSGQSMTLGIYTGLYRDLSNLLKMDKEELKGKLFLLHSQLDTPISPQGDLEFIQELASHTYYLVSPKRFKKEYVGKGLNDICNYIPKELHEIFTIKVGLSILSDKRLNTLSHKQIDILRKFYKFMSDDTLLKARVLRVLSDKSDVKDIALQVLTTLTYSDAQKYRVDKEYDLLTPSTSTNTQEVFDPFAKTDIEFDPFNISKEKEQDPLSSTEATKIKSYLNINLVDIYNTLG